MMLKITLHVFVQNCQENTAGPSCNICASGYYGNPANGIPCRPCKCPSADRNYAGNIKYDDEKIGNMVKGKNNLHLI